MTEPKQLELVDGEDTLEVPARCPKSVPWSTGVVHKTPPGHHSVHSLLHEQKQAIKKWQKTYAKNTPTCDITGELVSVVPRYLENGDIEIMFRCDNCGKVVDCNGKRKYSGYWL
jgi:hypothetical protein